MLRRGFDDKFLGYPLITDSVHHASVKNIEISLYAQGQRFHESTLNPLGNA